MAYVPDESVSLGELGIEDKCCNSTTPFLRSSSERVLVAIRNSSNRSKGPGCLRFPPLSGHDHADQIYDLHRARLVAMTSDEPDNAYPHSDLAEHSDDRDISMWTVSALGAGYLASAVWVLLWLTPPGRLVSLWIGIALGAGTILATWLVALRRPLMEFLSDNFGAALGISWGLGALLTLLSFPIGDSIFISLAIFALMALAGVFALIIAAATFHRPLQAIIGVAAILAVSTTAHFGAGPITDAGTATRLWLAESRYQRDLTAIQVEGPEAVENYPTIIIDPGPPQRVFWQWWSGVLDNFGGILNDPSQTAENDRAALTNDRSLSSTCRRLYADWYYCAFN